MLITTWWDPIQNYYKWVDKDDLHKLIGAKSWLTTMTITQLDNYLGKDINNS